MNVNFDAIKAAAEGYRADMSKFLRDMIAIPSESCDEKRVVHRIKEEMEKVGFDKVEIDPMGNVLGYIGHGPRLGSGDAGTVFRALAACPVNGTLCFQGNKTSRRPAYLPLFCGY